MIFSGNTTALGATTIPMAEGYDCSCGISLALVESARNDLAMFKALVQADYKEMSICSESTGVVQEGEVVALHEAVGGGIFKKIAELFKKLVAKIKSIFHNLIARFRNLYMKDKDLVKKYQQEILRKPNIEKLEVKFRKPKNGHESVTYAEMMTSLTEFDGKTALDFAKAHSDSWERVAHFLGDTTCDNTSEYIKEFIDEKLEDEDTLKVSEIGGMRKIITFISEYDKKLKTMETNMRKTTSNIEKLVSYYNKLADGLAKNSTSGDGKFDYRRPDGSEVKINATETTTNNANKLYEMAQAYQTAMLAQIDAVRQIATIEYKQNKAAFMKAVTINPKNLEESAIYAEAVAAVAENEVEDVINGALSKEELSDLCSASKNVMDGGVSDDPDKLTYGPDKYTDDASFSGSQGSIDSRIGGGKVEEAYFGKLFY